jgi:hypothetical protein
MTGYRLGIKCAGECWSDIEDLSFLNLLEGGTTASACQQSLLSRSLRSQTPLLGLRPATKGAYPLGTLNSVPPNVVAIRGNPAKSGGKDVLSTTTQKEQEIAIFASLENTEPSGKIFIGKRQRTPQMGFIP